MGRMNVLINSLHVFCEAIFKIVYYIFLFRAEVLVRTISMARAHSSYRRNVLLQPRSKTCCKLSVICVWSWWWAVFRTKLTDTVRFPTLPLALISSKIFDLCDNPLQLPIKDRVLKFLLLPRKAFYTAAIPNHHPLTPTPRRTNVKGFHFVCYLTPWHHLL